MIYWVAPMWRKALGKEVVGKFSRLVNTVHDPFYICINLSKMYQAIQFVCVNSVL